MQTDRQQRCECVRVWEERTFFLGATLVHEQRAVDVTVSEAATEARGAVAECGVLGTRAAQVRLLGAQVGRHVMTAHTHTYTCTHTSSALLCKC
jgi:hypothetical protein